MTAPIPYLPVPRLWPHETAVILACGPSLCLEDVAYCRGKARVIAVNDAWTLAPWADAMWATDGRWWTHHQGVKAFQGLKFGLTVNPGLWPDVHVLENTGPLGLEGNPTGVRTGKNSGYAVLNLAVHLGCTKLILLGYDLGHAPGMPSHFFGEHPRALLNASPYPAFRAAFDAIVEPLQALGVDVVNCSRETTLTAFPRMALVEALAAVRAGAVA